MKYSHRIFILFFWEVWLIVTFLSGLAIRIWVAVFKTQAGIRSFPSPSSFAEPLSPWSQVMPGVLKIIPTPAKQSWLIISCNSTALTEEEDGGEIYGSGVHFPLPMGETPSWYSEEQSEQPTVSQHIWRLEYKNCRDIEKSGGKTIKPGALKGQS